MCLGFRDSFAVALHGKGNDAGAVPNALARADPRVITSIANCDPGTFDISGHIQIFFGWGGQAPPFVGFTPSPSDPGWQQGEQQWHKTAQQPRPPAAAPWSFPARWRPGLTGCLRA